MNIKLLDISAVRAKKQKYVKGSPATHGVKHPPKLEPKPLEPREKLLSPEFLTSILDDVCLREDADAKRIHISLDESKIELLSRRIKDLDALQLSTMLLAERGLSILEIGTRLDGSVDNVQRVFLAIYERLEMKTGICKVEPRLKRTALNAAWRKFVRDNAKK